MFSQLISEKFSCDAVTVGGTAMAMWVTWSARRSKATGVTNSCATCRRVLPVMLAWQFEEGDRLPRSHHVRDALDPSQARTSNDAASAIG